MSNFQLKSASLAGVVLFLLGLPSVRAQDRGVYCSISHPTVRGRGPGEWYFSSDFPAPKGKSWSEFTRSAEAQFTAYISRRYGVLTRELGGFGCSRDNYNDKTIQQDNRRREGWTIVDTHWVYEE